MMHSAPRSQAFHRVFLLPFMLLLMMFALSGCGDKEPAQRKAFIDFLQSRILDKPALAVPQLTEAQKKQFGDYTQDYAIITGFHHQMNIELDSSLVPVFAGMNGVNSVSNLLEQRDDLKKMADSSEKWKEKIVLLKTQADTRHAALKQPDDLKKIYDQAYEKTIVKPTQITEQVFDLLPQVLNLIVAKADFIKNQGKNVTITGNRLQFANQKQLDKYNAIQQQLVPLNAQLMQLSRQMQQMVR
ncbi:DUF3053 domain-containing protein [Rahnella sp. C60]|uniref:DUF3053 domain-containing protein n=2 Tax=Yersiniaceae TaxID=1903411 RepID=A0ABS6KXW8_9GAMM|nr:DUF3053 domain-containing protein [Rahnella perminowiae]MBU9816350.1 DUF3053 domain-containing protein [Rahnella perminowiae]MBU9826524.1 DUF3053 domain-containing protein [Rahnella perminowiae]MBU9834440.1 DUF3053 domain-containing protein [Rahnella perminowiae]